MITDWKALCAELIDEWDAASGDPDLISFAIAIDRARAALAQPEPVGPTDEELKAAYWEAFVEAAPCGADESWLAGLRAVARLSHPTPQPIPVSERLPGPEDCDADGFCWWFSAADPTVGTFGVAACWVLRKREPDDDDWRTHWLPATALPLPRQPAPDASAP